MGAEQVSDILGLRGASGLLSLAAPPGCCPLDLQSGDKTHSAWTCMWGCVSAREAEPVQGCRLPNMCVTGSQVWVQAEQDKLQL